ncbi:GGDEF domain-containing protein [Vibrio sp.]|uniref:GGDEF domain-containing protein n=1 Tax=Vibrio sp. TaxID=678 RepID=UPI003D14A703
MINTEQNADFHKLILDTITEHIAVINSDGDILFVNKSWDMFAQDNHCFVQGQQWSGVNYLKICDIGASKGDLYAHQAAEGIRQVINREVEIFYFEYPCHSDEEFRWFMMRVTPFVLNDDRCFAISHQKITERKLAEQQMEQMARLDGLTGIPCRRIFDEFLSNEWARCTRLQMPISLAIIDLDYFKLLNDHYGHLKGDECLKQVASVLHDYAARPSDLCARYGGEEFTIIMGNNGLEQSTHHLESLLSDIRSLKIENKLSPVSRYLTASIGLASVIPCQGDNAKLLVEQADINLYRAKSCGRNQICV